MRHYRYRSRTSPAADQRYRNFAKRIDVSEAIVAGKVLADTVADIRVENRSSQSPKRTVYVPVANVKLQGNASGIRGLNKRADGEATRASCSAGIADAAEYGLGRTAYAVVALCVRNGSASAVRASHK